MSAFMLVEIMVKDISGYEKYMELIPSVIEKYKGRYVVRSSKVTPIKGGWNPDRIILIEFDNINELSNCFQSSEYSELAPLREKSTITRSVIIEN